MWQPDPDLVIKPKPRQQPGGGSADLGRVPEPLTDSFEKRASGASAYRDQSFLAVQTTRPRP